MTFDFSVQGRDTLWALADRRLSYGAASPSDDTGVKLMSLETRDGTGVLAYAGLGATLKGTEPSTWMSAVLRGRSGLTFEQSLSVLAEAATRELPRHLVSVGEHFIIAPAFLRGVGPMLYVLDHVFSKQGNQHAYRFVKYQNPSSLPPRIAVAGSGARYVLRQPNAWHRPLLRLVKANDCGAVSDILVADRLAEINYEVCEAIRKVRGPDKDTVGPRSIVVWRRRPEVGPERGGGGQQFYTGTDRDRDSPGIPSIGNGMNMKPLAGIFMRQMQQRIRENGIDFTKPPVPLDTDEINRLIAHLPRDPDENLR